jgi:hypothetical protein
MKLLNWIKNLIKKNKNDMLSEEQLINYQQNFSGQSFQWIKTDRPELMGKVVKVRDIDIRGTVVFDDGSKVLARDLNQKLMMITGDMQPLSKAEVSSISAPHVPEARPASKLANGEISPASSPIIPKPNTQSNTNQPNTPAVNPFSMFNSDEIEIALKLKIKMPDKKLLKLMYSNAEDKEAFLDQLSKYVNSEINNTVVLDSVKAMLDPKSTTKKANVSKPAAEVQLTEINNETKG